MSELSTKCAYALDGYQQDSKTYASTFTVTS